MRKVINLISQATTPIGIQAECRGSSATILPATELIPFDTVASSSSGTILMSGNSFTVTVPGVYSISYYVNTGGTETKTSVTILCNGLASEGTYSNQGQMSGFALLSLEAGDTISLSNGNMESLLLDVSDIQAGINIIRVG